jgi:hypothetical protein
VSDDLTAFLGSVDARLVDYLDSSGDLSTDAIRRMQCYGVALLQDLVLPEHVHEDWPDFFPLVVAFVLAHGSASLGHLARRAAIFEGGGDDPLADGDRLFVMSLIEETRAHLTQRAQ